MSRIDIVVMVALFSFNFLRTPAPHHEVVAAFQGALRVHNETIRVWIG